MKGGTVALEGFAHNVNQVLHLHQDPYLVRHAQQVHILLQGRPAAVQALWEHILDLEQEPTQSVQEDILALEVFSAHGHQEHFLQQGRPCAQDAPQGNILLVLLVFVVTSLLDTILILEQPPLQSAQQDTVALEVFLHSALEGYILQ